jgi:hypothetical protein
MTPISIGRMAAAVLALTAAGGAVLFSGILSEKQPSLETTSASPAGMAPADVRLTALPPAFSPRSPDSSDVIRPSFDVALVGRAGDAVIAGTAAPGAAVELLRNGEPLDRAIADQSGQFVMTPSQLPSGDYELTLRSRLGNGKQATSSKSVPLTVQPSLTHRKKALIASDKASVVPAMPVLPSTDRHLRAHREATGPARPKLFNRVVGSRQ